MSQQERAVPNLVQREQPRPGVTVARFANGLRAIVKEDHRSEVAVCHVWVRVGSNWEPDHLRGWAHGIEHMVFKGTARRRESDFAREVAEAGGSTNAGTGYETTSYYIELPAAHLDRACDILSDALGGATFAPESLDPEREVLVHENHMYDDIPAGFGITWRWGLETAFDRSPYRHPIGGRDEELLRTPREEIVGFYRRAYRPDNMTVVVVGAVPTDAALALVGSHFGAATDAGAAPLPVPPTEPPQTGLRFRLERGELQQAYAKLIFHAPGELSPDQEALGVLQRILSDGRSCRLYRVVQEERQLVSDIALLTETGPREGLAMVDLETDTARLAPALAATLEVLEDLKRRPVSDDELERAKIRVERSFLFGAETVHGQSSTIGYHDAIGDLARAFDTPARVRAVRAEDVRELARELFRPSNLTVLLYLPQDDDLAAAGVPPDLAALETLVAPLLADGPAIDFARAPRPAQHAGGGAAAPSRPATPAPAAVPRFERHDLSCGLPAFVRVDRALPVVSLGLFSAGGACHEPSPRAGLAALTVTTQVKGAGGLDAEALHAAIEGEGAALSPRAERDYAGLMVTGLSRRLEGVLPLLGAVAARPGFPEEEIARERRLALDQLRALADDPFQSAAIALRRMMYGDHPYGRPVRGTEDAVAALGRDEVAAFHARTWRTANLFVVVSGDVDPDRLLPRLEEQLAPLADGAAPARPALAPARRPEGIARERIERRIHQGVVLLAWPGPPDPDTDRAPLLLLKQLLNGQSGRLFEELRNRRSLCYNTGSFSTAGFGQGMLAGYVLTDPASAEEALAVMAVEMEKIAAAAAPDAEFARARAELVGQLLLAHQSNSARVVRGGAAHLYGRDPDDLPDLIAAIEATTPAEVRDAAARYVDPARRFEVILGPPATAG